MRQQRVDPVLGLDPKAGEQVEPPFVPCQNTLDQVVGAQKVGLLSQVAQDRFRGLMPIGCTKGGPQKPFLGTMVGQRKQVLLGPTKQRRFQRRRQRQVIFRQGKERQKRCEVSHSKLGTDPQSVRARNLQISRLTRTDHFGKQPCFAPPHKDQNITLGNQAMVIGACVSNLDGQGFKRDHMFDLRGHAACHDDNLACLAGLIDRGEPFALLLVLHLFDHGP